MAAHLSQRILLACLHFGQSVQPLGIICIIVPFTLNNRPQVFHSSSFFDWLATKTPHLPVHPLPLEDHILRLCLIEPNLVEDNESLCTGRYPPAGN